MRGYDNPRFNHEMLLDLQFCEGTGTVTLDWAKAHHAGATLTGAPAWTNAANDLTFLDFDLGPPRDYIVISTANSGDLDFTTGGDDKLELMFWHWYDTEFNYDGGNVKLFTPSDTVVLHPDVSQCPDYDDDAIYSYNEWIPNEPGYSGHDQKQWEAAVFDLTPWTDESDVVIAFDFGSNSSVYMYPGWFIDDVVIGGNPPLALPVAMDIKPQSCPNPLNTSNKGVLPVAILGTETFDVTTIDPATLELEGVAPLRWYLEDVSTPVGSSSGKGDVEERSRPVDPRDDFCDCTEDGPDGFTDLTLKFDTQEIVAALEGLVDREVRFLTLRGWLNDGCTPIQGQDCVWILLRHVRELADSGHDLGPQSGLVGSYPNPFNAETNITFGLPERTRVSLVIYNILGERVKTLVARELDAGTHTAHWDGKDETGGSVASGIYFYRFETEKFAQTKKLVLLK